MSEARRSLHSSLRPRAELVSHSGWGSDPRAGACDRPLCHGPFHEGEWGAGFSLVVYFLGVSLGVSGPPRGWEPGPSFPARLLLASPTDSGHARCPPGRRTGTAVNSISSVYRQRKRTCHYGVAYVLSVSACPTQPSGKVGATGEELAQIHTASKQVSQRATWGLNPGRPAPLAAVPAGWRKHRSAKRAVARLPGPSMQRTEAR